MDSIEVSILQFIREKMDFLSKKVQIPRGFHTHNNLSLFKYK